MIPAGVPIDSETISVGLLERLWHATAVGAIRGDIGKFDNELIAEMVGWQLPADNLIAVLIECGWLDECGIHRLVVHDWNQHAPKHVKANVAKAGGFHSPAPKEPPKGEPPKEPPQGSSPPNLTNSNLTKPNQFKGCSGVGTADPKPPILVFPCRGVPNSWILDQGNIDRWQEQFPNLDIIAQCRHALAWIEANNPKTAGGMPKFLVRWFSKSNDRQPGNRNSQMTFAQQQLANSNAAIRSFVGDE